MMHDFTTVERFVLGRQYVLRFKEPDSPEMWRPPITRRPCGLMSVRNVAEMSNQPVSI